MYQGAADKKSILQALTSDLSEAAYIGDDINDLPCMEAVRDAGGITGCPADAAECVRRISDYVAGHKGGGGAVGDFIEWIIRTDG